MARADDRHVPWRFAPVPTAALDDVRLGKHERLTLMALCSFVDNGTSRCSRSLKTIAKRACLAPSSVAVALSRLEGAGWIRRQRRFEEGTGEHASTLYTITGGCP